MFEIWTFSKKVRNGYHINNKKQDIIIIITFNNNNNNNNEKKKNKKENNLKLKQTSTKQIIT